MRQQSWYGTHLLQEETEGSLRITTSSDICLAGQQISTSVSDLSESVHQNSTIFIAHVIRKVEDHQVLLTATNGKGQRISLP